MLSIISHLLLSCLQAPKGVLFGPGTRQAAKGVLFPPAPARLEILNITKKSTNFQLCFQGSENQKNCSQGLQKTRRMHPQIYKNGFREKLFLQELQCGNLDS